MHVSTPSPWIKELDELPRKHEYGDNNSCTTFIGRKAVIGLFEKHQNIWSNRVDELRDDVAKSRARLEVSHMFDKQKDEIHNAIFASNKSLIGLLISLTLIYGATMVVLLIRTTI